MLLYLTGRHLELTDPLRRYVEEHLVRAVERHGGRLDVVSMEVQLYEPAHREVRTGCHVLLNLPDKRSINIREESHDMYEAIDLAEKRLVRDLTDFRERIVTEARHPKKYHAAEVALGERELREREVELEQEELRPVAEEEASRGE
jgi:putative sigma-54 modulation protein